MSTLQKSSIKKIKKGINKNPKIFLIVLIILAILLACGIGGYFFIQSRKPVFELNGSNVCSVQLNEEYKEQGAYAKYKGEDVSNEVKITYHHETRDGEVVDKIKTETETVYFAEYSISIEDWTPNNIFRQINVGTDPISITFLELGNFHTGDSTYIKAGETDILIDAGSTKSSSTTITNFLNKSGNVDDNVIEYLIVTHAHEDHISALIGSKSNPGIFDNFKIKNIIQFSQTKNSDGALYKEYQSKVEDEIKNDGAKLYLAGDLTKNNKNVFEIAANTKLTILDQKYYHEMDKNDENNHSVCSLISHGKSNYLFTGDLEASGEKSLVELNPNLPKCQLFKGGHHGSYTANTTNLLNVIQPEVVCFCCCAGNDEYTKDMTRSFPAQENNR